MKLARALALSTLVSSCSGSTVPPDTATVAPDGRKASCSYHATATDAEAGRLLVHLTCEGIIVDALRARRQTTRYVSHLEQSGRPLPGGSKRFELRRGNPVDVRYEFDLAGAAAAFDDYDVALSIGRSIVTPLSTWALGIEPAPRHVITHVSVDVPPPGRFVTGLDASRLGSEPEYRLHANEIRTGTYGAFGVVEVRTLKLEGGEPTLDERTIDVAFMDGPLGASRDGVSDWVLRGARAVESFYGRFPADRAVVTIAPVPGAARVLSGKLLPESGSGVLLLLGEGATRASLDRDWILVHELFHIGSPSFVGEGKWLDEGLATYFEPIIRARAGLITEDDVWDEFAREMPRGLDAMEHRGLAQAKRREVYWGGAIFALLADVEARRRSGGRVGLEDGLREVLRRGGHASNVWRVQRFIEVVDETLGAPVLAELSARHVRKGHPVRLTEHLGELGVERGADGRVTLRDDAPLSALRRRIVLGPDPSSAASDSVATAHPP